MAFPLHNTVIIPFHMTDFNAIRMDFGESMQKAEAVRLKPNISRDNDLSIFGHGALPHRPTKGLPFSIVCFCHRQQQPKTSLETFGRKYFFFRFP